MDRVCVYQWDTEKVDISRNDLIYIQVIHIYGHGLRLMWICFARLLWFYRYELAPKSFQSLFLWAFKWDDDLQDVCVLLAQDKLHGGIDFDQLLSTLSYSIWMRSL